MGNFQESITLSSDCNKIIIILKVNVFSDNTFAVLLVKKK